MTLDELIEAWESDSEFRPDLIYETKRIPLLHVKYYKMLRVAKQQQRKLQEDYQDTETRRTLYYTGKGDPQEYKQNPFNYIVKTKDDLRIWLNADPDLRKVKRRLDAIGDMVEALEEIVRQINVRNFLIKNILEAKRFEAGEA